MTLHDFCPLQEIYRQLTFRLDICTKTPVENMVSTKSLESGTLWIGMSYIKHYLKPYILPKMKKCQFLVWVEMTFFRRTECYYYGMKSFLK